MFVSDDECLSKEVSIDLIGSSAIGLKRRMADIGAPGRRVSMTYS